MKIRPANQVHAHKLSFAIDHLKKARSFLKFAGCPKLLAKVRSALKSADGARRHLDHRMRRTNSDGTTRHYADRAQT